MKGKDHILVYVLVFTFLLPWHQEDENIPEEKEELPNYHLTVQFLQWLLYEYRRGLKHDFCLWQAARVNIRTPLASSCSPWLWHLCSVSHGCVHTAVTEPMLTSRQTRSRPNKLRIKKWNRGKVSMVTKQWEVAHINTLYRRYYKN